LAVLAALGLAAICGLGFAALRAPSGRARAGDPEDVEALWAVAVAPAGRPPVAAERFQLQRLMGMRARKLARLAMAFHGGKTKLSKECSHATDAHFEKVFTQLIKRTGDLLDRCERDDGTAVGETSSPECKAVTERLETLRDDIEKDCAQHGELCKATKTFRDGRSHRVTHCIPSACHGELDKLADHMLEKRWMKRKAVKLSLSCPP